MLHTPDNSEPASPGGRNGRGAPRAGIIRVGIVEADELMADGLESLMRSTPDLVCVGAWRTLAETTAGLPAAAPDVLVLDLRLPDSGAFELLRALPALSPRTRVLAEVDCREDRCVVVHPRSASTPNRHVRVMAHELALPDDCLQVALKLGVHGALRRQRPFADLAQAIRDVHAGQFRMEGDTAVRLAQQHVVAHQRRRISAQPGARALTLREQQVLRLVADGRSNKEIAGELQLRYSTVKNYVSNILEKVGLGGRTQLALYATELAQDGPGADGAGTEG